MDPITGNQRFKVANDLVQPPSLPVIGDILYNLRSALDHLAWQLVLKAGGTPGRGTEFPIFNDPAQWDKNSPRDMAGMCQTMKDRIKVHQPCFGTNPNRNQAMWGLQEYGNTDKHRKLLIVVSSSSGTIWHPGGAAVHVHEGPVQKNTVLAEFLPTQPKDYIRSVPDIAFGEPPALNEAVYSFLGLIELRVTRVVQEFEATFF